MAGIIDLSDPTPFEIEQGGGLGSIRGLLDTLAQIEGIRRDRDVLKRLIIAKAADPTASDVSILAGLTEPEFSPGLQGIFERIGSALPGGQGTVLSQLQGAQIQTPLQRAQTEATRALGVQRETPKPRKGLTLQEKKKRASDLKIEFQQTGDEPQELGRILKDFEELDTTVNIASDTDFLDEDAFAEQVKKFKKFRVIRKKGIIDDEVNGKEVLFRSLKALLEAAMANNVRPSTVIEAFHAWWDKQFEAKKGQDFQEFADRKTFSPETAESAEARKLQSGRVKDAVLGGGEIPESKTAEQKFNELKKSPVFNKMSEEEKASAKRAFEQGRTLEEVIRLLQ